MARLTKKDRRKLEAALEDIERAFAYIHGEDVAVCRVAQQATTTLHYTRPADDRKLFEVERRIGSDLCRLEVARDALRVFLREE